MLPAAILERIMALTGDNAEQIEEAFQAPSPVSLRVNPLKGIEVNGVQVPWCEAGYFLEQRPSFVNDPMFHAGAYYVQEAGSMFLEQFVSQTGMDSRPIAALDLCASPGGKTTHLRALLHSDSLLVANEVVPKRRNVLEENIWKWGYRNVCISQARASSFAKLGERFDMILIDAPCSGAGMMRKDAFAIEQWNEQLVEQCARDQKDILDQAWASLRPGGLLIYSTCTFMSEENEDQVNRMRSSHNAELVVLPELDFPGLTIAEEGIYFFPQRSLSEGFFISGMRKPGLLEPREDVSPGGSSSNYTFEYCQTQNQHFYENEELILAIDLQWKELVEELSDGIGFFIGGVPVSLKKGDQWVPHPALALNELLAEDVYFLEVDTAEALALLRGDVIRRDVQKGYAVARYQSLPLMWLKGAGNRWNQSWPKGWRIRSHNV